MSRARRLFATETSVPRVLGALRDRSARPGPPAPVLNWLECGRGDLVEELLLALLATRPPTYEMVKTFREVLQRFARTRRTGSIAAVVRIAGLARAAGQAADRGPTYPGAWVRDGDRDVAAWLCDGQRLGDLTPLFATATAGDELIACLLHEAVLRHGDLASVAEAVAFAHRLRDAGHPLGGLPLRLLEIERWYAPERRLKPRFIPDGHPMPYQRRPRPAHAVDGPPGLEVVAVEVEWPAARQARQALPDYQADSPTAESRRFLLDRPLPPEEFGASALLCLPAGCFCGARQVRAWRAGTADVWALLYEQSLWGGPYRNGRGAAYSRAAAWKALAALCGATGGPEDLEAVEAAAAGCAWLIFESDSDWYMRVDESMDLGVAALWPDHRTAVVLAATDSD